jgi:hypothetical protein
MHDALLPEIRGYLELTEEFWPGLARVLSRLG